MNQNPFTFLGQAITQLLTSNLSTLEATGLDIFRGLAVIMIVWFGVKSALSASQGHGGGFHLANFADLILVIAFGLGMLTYYSTPIPGIGDSFEGLITQEAIHLSSEIESGQTQQIATAIVDAENRLGSPPGIFSFHEDLTIMVVSIALAAMQAVAFAVIAYGLVATAVCILIGPIFIPWFIVPRLDWLFWGWFKALIGFSFYQVVASAFIFIFARVLLGMLAVIGPITLSNAFTIMPALLITLFVCIFGLLKIPELTGSILGGRSGSWINPMGS